MQPRFQINLFIISTVEGHQILQPVLKIKYSKHKTQSPTNNACILPSFTRSRVQHNFYRTEGSSYSLKIYFFTKFEDIQGPKTNFNTSKIQSHPGAKRYRTKMEQHGASRFISFSFLLQKDTRTWNQV